VIAATGLVVMLAIMLIELRVSVDNERSLRARGAIPADDPVYPVMRLAYPGVFIAMAIEGIMTTGGWRLAAGGWREATGNWRLAALGVCVLVAAKVLKCWAVTALGGRWTFRVFVLPGAPLVTSGPYRWFRHPNYIAVLGELIGFALLTSAPVTGLAGLVFFGALLRRRIRSEEQALAIR
jgi:methyltransferase